MKKNLKNFFPSITLCVDRHNVSSASNIIKKTKSESTRVSSSFVLKSLPIHIYLMIQNRRVRHPSALRARKSRANFAARRGYVLQHHLQLLFANLSKWEHDWKELQKAGRVFLTMSLFNRLQFNFKFQPLFFFPTYAAHRKWKSCGALDDLAILLHHPSLNDHPSPF